MNPELKVIIYEEKKVLKNMLSLLDEQHDYVINNDAIKMDMVAKELDEVAKALATMEINRRKIMGGEASVRELVENCDEDNIKKVYNEITNTLRMIEIQKEANSTLIKQRMFFTKKMINFIKPNQGIGTYNACGQVGK